MSFCFENDVMKYIVIKKYFFCFAHQTPETNVELKRKQELEIRFYKVCFLIDFRFKF